MEQQNTHLQQPAAVSEPAIINSTEKPPVPPRDRALAFALLVLGYLVCRFQIHDHPLLGLLYGLLLFGLTLWHFRFRAGKRALGMGAVAILFLLSHLVTDNGPVRLFARWFAVLLWGYGVYCAGDNSAEEKLGDMFVPEFFKANVLMPFSRLGAFFTAAFTGGKRNGLKTVLFLLLGLGLALLPLFLVVNLLQYDPAFEGLLGKLFTESLPEAVVRRLMCLVTAVILATLLMSCLFGSRERRMARVLAREQVAAFRIRRRFLPLLVSVAMLLPLLLVYELFFFSQLPLYTAAFTGTLPQGYTYADYAREGFFQLCTVCAINGCVCLFLGLFTRQEKGQILLRILLSLLCLCSLVLAATAASKMVLYIQTYGLTPLRVYASWGMAALVGAFLLALVSAYWKKLNLVRSLICLFVLMFGCLCVVDTNALIAEYNVRAYEQGRLDTVDMGVFWELGDSAAPAAVRLVNDGKYGEEAKNFLSRHGKKTFFDALCHGLPGLRARAICAPYWQDPAVVRVRIETEDGIEALECRYGHWADEYSAGICTNADGSRMTKGQEVFFELEQVRAGDSLYVEKGSVTNFELWVQHRESDGWAYTNQLSCPYGEEIRIRLTGSPEEGYTIAPAD